MRPSRVFIASTTYLAVGLVATTLAAQAIGWCGRVGPPYSRMVYARLGDQSIELSEDRGFGRRELTWRTLDPWAAAIWQDIREKRAGAEHPPEPRYSPKGAVPAWCSVWDNELRAISVNAHTNATNQRVGVDPPFDVGIGWPLISFSVSKECQVDPTVALPPPAPVHGGLIKTKNGLPPLRVLSWRPYLPGLLADTVVWALAVALLTRLTLLARSQRRRHIGLCPSCAYDRRGLPQTSPCPECGLK